MLERFLIETCEKYPFEYREKDKVGAYTLVLGDMQIKILPLDPGMIFTGVIGKVPKNEELEDAEAFYIFMAQANYLGQGTGGNIISVEESGKTFLLERKFNYQIHLPLFLDTVESFVNYLEYWQGKIKEFEQKGSTA
jgi:hypothetical protein